ncbi:ribonuclease H [Labilibacter sediminis]|nr:ribonuclease H [Labilibacter sediminis]
MIVDLYIDGSVNTQTKTGFGAMLPVPLPLESYLDLNSLIEVQKFENTSSTKLELQTFLWAISKLEANITQINVYTDSQNILSLIERREKLEQKEFCNAKGVKIVNHLLYQQFYAIIDEMNIFITKLKGHQKSSLKEHQDKLFSLVDKASRRALREYTKAHP